VQCIREGVEKAGRRFDEVDIAGLCWASISEDGRVAEEVLKTMIAYFGPYLEAEALAKIGLTSQDFDKIKKLVDKRCIDEATRLVDDNMLRLAIIGGAKELIEAIDRLRKLGVSQVSIGGPLGPDPEDSIHIIGKKVIPYFKREVD
ncbi:MAG: LLM class flavin-dependent oxidoreductase, partial [Nitrososphaerales archaeon]